MTDSPSMLHTLTPEQAYANAPTITAEIAWLARQITTKAPGTDLPREFWLRKLATLDRIGLRDEDPAVLPEIAAAAALLLELDAAHTSVYGNPVSLGTYPADHPLWDHLGPLAYLRQEYRAWTKHAARAA